MTEPATKNHNVLLEMSTLAEHGVEQARKAFEELMNVTHRVVQTFEGQTAWSEQSRPRRSPSCMRTLSAPR
jgi:hypothetical protein